MSDNPLLQINELPPFEKIKPAHVLPAVEQAITHCKKVIDDLVNNPPSELSWEKVIHQIEEADDRLDKLWSPVDHMNSVVSSEALREAYESCLSLLSDYSTWAGQHKGLFALLTRLADCAEASQWTVAQRTTLKNALRDFKLSGIALPEAKQKRFAEISSRLSDLSAKFSNNVLDATMGWTKLITDKKELAGLPDSALEALRLAAQAKDLTGYLLTLNIPAYLPIMTYCDNRDLRKTVYEAFSTRASDVGPGDGKWDNSANIEEILKLRVERAQLLDFRTHAHRSVETKMAQSPEEVMSFLNGLASKVKPQAQTEVATLKEFAKKQFGVAELELWDYAYYSEKQKQHLFSFSSEALRAYFPEDRVIQGLFEVVKRIFGLKIVRRNSMEAWHKDVSYYEIFDEQGVLRGAFYFDLYAREHKRGGAWMNVCRTRRETVNGQQQVPVAYLTCNFNGPMGDQAALFTHDEVVTLFHEFGHGIHHMLTKVNVAAVSGISGVPWDAVELPSQFLENWCWEEDALQFISGHHETGEPLPKAMLDKMLEARNYQSGMGMARQLEFGLFDFTLHTQEHAPTKEEVLKISKQVKQQISPLPLVEWARQPHSFSHIFSGGYSAGYYSYLWAEVLSADAYSMFEEEGIFNRETGRRFMTEILEKGGSEAPEVLFERFRGRAPQPEALLRHSGINQ